MKIFLILSLVIICLNCTNKKAPENDSVVNEIATIENKIMENKTSANNTTNVNPIDINNFDIRLINSKIGSIENFIKYNNKDILTVYKNKSKESDFILINHEYVFLMQTDENSNWFYLITDDFNTQGYIYLYDISEISFYGEPEANLKNGNYYRYQQNKEHEIVKQYTNINRYGPLLSVKHKNKAINFLDKNNGEITGKNYLLLDYYPESNEILVMEQYWESASMFIYNLDAEEYRCERIETPYFNNEKTYMLSIIFIEDIGTLIEYVLKLFEVDDGYYNEIYHQKYNINRKWSLNGIIWINNSTAYIDYEKKGGITVEIGNTVNVKNSLPSLSWDDLF